METILTAGALTALVMELIKWVIKQYRIYVLKNTEPFDFVPLFYKISVPVLNALMPFALFWLGIAVESPVLSMAPLALLKYVIVVALSSVVSQGSYNLGVKPLKEYTKYFIETKMMGSRFG